MIVPMTRYSVLVFHRDFATFMEKLQQEGLLDIRQNEVHTPQADTEFYPILQRIEKVQRAFKLEAKELKESKGQLTEVSVDMAAVTDGESYLAKAESALADKKELTARITESKAALKKAEVWGEFDKDKLARLQKESGLRLVPASMSEKYFPQGEALAALPVEAIGRESGSVYFVYVCPLEEAQGLTAESLSAIMGASVSLCELPTRTAAQWEKEIQTCEAALESRNGIIRGLLSCQEILKSYKTDLMNRLEYKTVSLNVPEEAEGSLRFIEGFLPTEKCEAFEEFLNREMVVYESVAAEKLPEEETPRIPVLLRNNRFAKLFEPITLLFSLPNYREIDLTPMLAPFFMAFFGFCFGDAGYGLLLIAIGLVLSKKLPESYKGFAWLAFWFGVSTVIFGGLSGTFFGISLVEVGALGKVRDYIFDSNKMMTLSLVIGGVQILFGMVMNVLRITKEQGFKYALSKVGWLAIIVCGGLLVGAPMMGITLPAAACYPLYVLVGMGALLAFFYNSPGKNPFLNLGLGLWDTYNTATGLVGDLLSYIRLFALGLTGGILGAVFNELAVTAGTGIGVPVVSQLIMLVILLFGHSLNIALCALGSVVHPLRLTFVEFYKNAGFEGGGKPYRPFSIQH